MICNGESHTFPLPSSPDIFKYNHTAGPGLQCEVQAVRESLIKGQMEIIWYKLPFIISCNIKSMELEPFTLWLEC